MAVVETVMEEVVVTRESAMRKMRPGETGTAEVHAPAHATKVHAAAMHPAAMHPAATDVPTSEAAAMAAAAAASERR
jgi:hypothetical protein